MAILIPGKEMPKSCSECFMSFCDGRKTVVHFAVERGDNCPLVEIPPHGRLIDADALPTYDKPIGKIMMFGGEYVYTQTAIDNAPTIIPAEEGEA